MGDGDARPARRLAGRATEQQLLADALGRTARGEPCAVVVHGEAGVGKTRLVREVCDALDPGTQVLWGTCLRFGEASVPFAPVTGVLRSWWTRADPATRAEILAGADELGTLLPGPGARRTSEPGRLLPLIDLVLNRLAGRRPTVVVVDDLHWADRTSLDVLAYLIAGFREQRLALLATCREEHRGGGHPLHTWLADMRRMPLFTDVHLERLDLAATESQLRGVLGHPVDIQLAAQVHERSGGNPYLTELLARGLTATDQGLPAAAPAELREALLAGWHGLSPAARQTTRVLAVGGRPTDPAVLAGVASEHGVEPTRLADCLTEAREQGVVRPDDEGRPWFRHPLLAEVLYDDLPFGEAARIHATYVRVIGSRVAGTAGRAAADLAVHNDRAGNVDETYRWSLVAADQAAVLRASAEEGAHLERACSLWEQVSPVLRGTPARRIELLRRAGRADRNIGRLDAAMARLEHALRLMDRRHEPLLASTLLIELRDLSWSRAPAGTAVVPELVEAVRLTRPFPETAEHARALAELASAESWDSLPAAAAHADEAVDIAHRAGSSVALAAALIARARVHGGEFRSTALANTEEAVRLARSTDDGVLLGNAALWRVNRLIELGRIGEATTVAEEAYRDVLAGGTPQSGYFLAAQAADGMLFLGRWDECRDLLRTALAARCTGITGGAVRLVAARLAARSGEVREAAQHLDRARELVADDFAGLQDGLSLAGAEVFSASGEPLRALEWLRDRVAVRDADPDKDDEDRLVALATAAADVAQVARDTGDVDAAAHALTTLDEVVGRWPGGPFASPGPDVAVQAMRESRFTAEVARCRGDADQAARWRRAVETCRAAGAPWEEAVAGWRCAQALLAVGAPRSEVGELLRRAHRVAVGIAARPLRGEVESLALIARVSLVDPVPVEGLAEPPVALVGLTLREREILAFLVAGRSNGEIARELVISDKTVSVHVSNILRKTGTSSRVEVAALAGRLGHLPPGRG